MRTEHTLLTQRILALRLRIRIVTIAVLLHGELQPGHRHIRLVESELRFFVVAIRRSSAYLMILVTV